MEEDEEPVGSGVPVVEGTQIESAVVEEGDAVQEEYLAMPQVPAVEGAQIDVEADGSGEEAVGQGDHPEKEKEG